MDAGFSRTKSQFAKMFLVIGTFVFLGFVTAGHHCLAEGPAAKSAQIEYIAPDGQFSPVVTAHVGRHAPAAAFVDNDTVSCVLREGETTFIIELPKDSPRDRFTFLNENAAASGELRIAVSDSLLPPDSPKWTEVDGIVPFAHKRLFKLSILGVDTRFVRLSFKVEGQRPDLARISNPFRSSVLATAFNSNFGRLHEHDLAVATASVAALPGKQN